MNEAHSVDRRPALVVFTQLGLLAVIGIVAYTVVFGFTALFRGQATGSSAPRMFVGVLFIVALVALLGVLFYGLSRRRRWSWLGSVAFAVFVASWLSVLYFRDRPGVGTLLEAETDPSKGIGEAVGRASLPLVAWAYALGLYFSPKVRGFLRVPHLGEHGR